MQRFIFEYLCCFLIKHLTNFGYLQSEKKTKLLIILKALNCAMKSLFRAVGEYFKEGSNILICYVHEIAP